MLGAAVWPVISVGQQPRRVGILQAGGSHSEGQGEEAFRKSLEGFGWSERRDIQFVIRAARGEDSRAREYARELTGLSLDVILATNTQMVQALHEFSRKTPVVFIQVPDPVGTGLVDSLSRPTGNTTGFINFDPNMASKWLGLLKESAPNLSKVAVLLHAGNPTAPGYLRAIEIAAPVFGLGLAPTSVRDATDIGTAIVTLAQAVGGIVIPPSSMASIYQDHIISLMALHKLPAVSSYREYTAAGGLMSYGYDRNDLYRRAALYVDRILRGTKAVDLPVQSPTKFELVVNVNAAKAIGLSIPPSLLARADEVIE
jgi:putative ABC transport system substrate-binding protein